MNVTIKTARFLELWGSGFDRATFNTALTGTQNGILAEYWDFPPGRGGGETRSETEKKRCSYNLRASADNSPRRDFAQKAKSRGGTLVATTSCKTTWDTVPYFGINGLSMILCLWSPLHPLSKLLAIQDHTQNLEEQLWMGGRREVSIISHRPVTRSDLKQERSFFRGSVSTFLQLVVWVLHTPIAVVHDY